MKTCFVVCPIGDVGSPIRKRSDQVFKYIISPACESNGFEPTRSDKSYAVDKIDQTIITHLESADLVIADLSDHNPNAFFELGYRTALKKPLIHIAAEGESLPFDVSGIRTIFYDLSDPDKLEECRNRLSETIKTLSIEDIPDDDTVLSAPPQQHINTQILTLLLEIRDTVADVKTLTEESNTKLIEQVISAFASKMQSVSTPQDKAMEIFFQEFMKNPQKTIKAMNQLSKIDFPN
ncbi:hypothetical protein [uncultured Selenomonas sp.]|uniref:hypothetical protein n=1 Tax=uncultured Selenomonas sp. TaxID=159275 RepID=UPI0028DD0352|nr:hypothetical protein [uncultured Selenomonas sp.]